MNEVLAGAVVVGALWILLRPAKGDVKPEPRPGPPSVPRPDEVALTGALRRLRLLELLRHAMRKERHLPFKLYPVRSLDRVWQRVKRRHPYIDVLERNEPPQGVSTPMPPLDNDTIHFKSDEPQTLEGYIGQPHIKSALQVTLGALPPDRAVPRHRLLTGLPGFGKTLLAKILGKTLQDRAQALGLGRVAFVETYGANLNSIDAMDEAVRQTQAADAAVWFIDEVHVLNRELATKLYLLLEDNRYPFEGSSNPTTLKPLMVVAATTDYGNLHPALKRRFGEPLMMQPLTRDDLRVMARQLLPTATDAAIHMVAERCVFSGAPYEIKILAEYVRDQATVRGVSSVDVDLVKEVFMIWQIDELGLRPIDRRVIQTMLQRPRTRTRDGEFLGYGGSETDICLTAGIDKAEFQQVIRPKLFSRQLIEVRAGLGLILTQRAVDYYQEFEFV